MHTRLLAAVLLLAGAGLLSGTAMAAGDAEAGKSKVITCGACHGQDGASPIDPTYPVLAGQNEHYLFRQLQMIQSGEREIALMAGQLTGKTEQDLADMAAYYAALPARVAQAQGDDEALARGASIYRGGILDKSVAACAACHSPSGSGNAPAGFPLVSGQSAAYTIKQLTAYREGERTTDESYGGMMRGVASKLTDGEIAVLADYLQGLH